MNTAPRRLRRRAALAAGVAAAAVAGRVRPAAAAPVRDVRDARDVRDVRAGRRGPTTPHVVLIVADDLGHGALGCYGQQVIRTPHLDRLAAEGIRFTQGYSAASVCAPSRAGLLTGMHGGHARVRSNSFRQTGVAPRLEPEDVTIAEVLRAAGYRTGAFGKWGLGPDSYGAAAPIGVTCDAGLVDLPGGQDAPTQPFGVADRGDASHPLQKGFDRFHGLVDTQHAFQYWPEYLWRGNRRVRLPENEGGERGAYAPERYLRSALEFLDTHAARHRDEPFFLYLAPQLVHFPNHVPDEALAPYAAEPWPEEMKRYAAQHTLLDAYVGAVRARLERLGLDRDTLLVFTGDNGPTPNEHLLVGSGACADVMTPSPESAAADVAWNTNGSLRAGKHSLYEGGVRVPLIVWGPGVVRRDAAGRRAVADRPWGSVDLLPTLADLAGVTAPSDVDGVSVRSWITGETGRRHRVDHPPLYFERPPNGDQNLDGGPPAQTVYTTAGRAGRWKAVRHAPGADPRVPDARARLELYDLRADPGETRDVAVLHPDVVARLQAFLRAGHAPPPFPRRAYRPRRTGTGFAPRRSGSRRGGRAF